MSQTSQANHNLVVQDDTVKWIKDSWVDDSGEVPDVVFGGFPFDYCVSYRPGTRLGPSKIMEALDTYSLYCTDRRADLSSLLMHNAGQVVGINNISKYYSQVADMVGEIDASSIFIGLGGDHSVSDPIVRGQAKRVGAEVGLIHIDAHFDSREPITEKEHSGHWVYTLQDVLDYRNVAQLGLNASIYAPQYLDKAEEQGAFIRTCSEVRFSNLKQLISEAIAHVSRETSHFHLSIDIDAIDQSSCPGTSVPNPCGLYAHEVVQIAYQCALSKNFIGCDIMEVSPPLDTDDRTSHVAAQIILHTLSGIVMRERPDAKCE